MSNAALRPAPKPRLSPKLRAAIELRVRRGLSIAAACREAGLSETGWHKAMRRPAVRQHLERVQADYIAGVDQLRATARARAVQIALEMLETGSESVRLKVLPLLLAAEPKAAQTAAVQVNVATAPGYVFARPGQRIVDVIDDTSEG